MSTETEAAASAESQSEGQPTAPPTEQGGLAEVPADTGAAALRAEQLTTAALEAHVAAGRLESATKEAREGEPSLLLSLAHGALWGAGICIATWGLGKLLDALVEPSQDKPFLRRVDGEEPSPTNPTSPAPVGAQ